MKTNNKEFILVEKYRPSTLDDIILPQTFKDQIKDWINKEEIPNMLLTSTTPGLGKSTLAHVLINELDTEAMFINASMESGIDVLRSKIKGFASTVSFEGKPKIVVLDEADYINPNSTQPAFRAFLDEFSKNCRFIFTANFKDKIIEPLQNRLVHFDFDEIFKNNKKELGMSIIKRLKFVLDNEGIEYSGMDQVKQVLLNMYPSTRKMIMYIQNNTSNNVFSVQDNIQRNSQFSTILQHIGSKDFTKMREEVGGLTEPNSLISFIFNNIDEYIEVNTQPQCILILADYQHKAAMAADKSLNITAMCTELMTKVKVINTNI